MTKTFLLVSHKHYNLSVSEGFVIFLTSKLNTCFIDKFTLKMKFQSIAYLLNVREHIYWILDLEDEVHSISVIWTSGLQHYNGNFIFQSRPILDFFMGFAYKCWITGPGPYPPPLKVRRGEV